MSISAYEKVKIARKNKRPTSINYIRSIFTEFFELHGDRAFGDDSAVVGGIARLNDRPVTVISIEKGRNLIERTQHAFGSPNPEGYRKALRLMKQAEKFNRPVVCLVDTSGAYPGVGAEERGQGQAIAECLMEMMTLKTPVISIIIGEGGSGGALALSVADEVWMLENSIYSVISPEGCASILWKDARKAELASEHLKLTAQDSLKNKIIERIISEDYLGEERFYDEIRALLSETLNTLSSLSTDTLLDNRYMRFRKIGN